MSLRMGNKIIAGVIPDTSAFATKTELKDSIETKITNCITEIPQDIKLELNNGTLTLKAGSKVYVPNGVDVFGEVVINTDRNLTSGWSTSNDKMLLFLDVATGNLVRLSVSRTVSGATDTYTGSMSHIWYNTTTNKVNWMNTDGSLGGQLSLPIAEFTALGDNTAIVTSIDQVFNGFGYIGSTVFALPGVKGLIPNGRNADGSLRNSEFYFSKVIVKNYSTTGGDWFLCLSTNSIGLRKLKYDDDENANIQTTDNTKQLVCNVGAISLLNGTITSFTPKTAFHALDYNDKSEISGWGMPSDRYIDLTLGASGTEYTAPANGCFNIRKRQSAVNQYLNMRSLRSGIMEEVCNPTSSGLCTISMECVKGETVKIGYNAGGNLEGFIFVYAEGEN